MRMMMEPLASLRAQEPFILMIDTKCTSTFTIFNDFNITDFHLNETNVSKCGYQLWNGALLFCDYILTNQSRFLNEIILELDTDIGLCSLIATQQIGLISRVFDTREALLDATISLASVIARKSSIAVQASKINLNYARDHTVDDNFTFVRTWNSAMLLTEDIVKNFMATSVSNEKSKL
ncbi:unnamed protein product [Rotaria sordida]|nr:unnamed protein product [Rotaria sordida]